MTEAQDNNTVQARRRNYKDEDAQAQPGTLKKMAVAIPGGTTRRRPRTTTPFRLEDATTIDEDAQAQPGTLKKMADAIPGGTTRRRPRTTTPFRLKDTTTKTKTLRRNQVPSRRW
jgi:hypothetical protein